MKFKVAKGAFTDAIQMVGGIVSSRTPLPVLSNVLLKAEKNKVWLSTTDLEVSVRYGVECDVGKVGVSTLCVRRLGQIVRELPAEEVEVEVDDKYSATIKCGSAFYKLVGASDEEFPAIPEFQGKYTYTMEQATLKNMLKNVAYAASTDETRFILNGVYLSFSGEKLTAVATDGRRLALMETEMEVPKEAEKEFILPSKTVNGLLAALKDEGAVKIGSSGNQIMFEFGDITIVSKLIDGTYPNFKQVIPSQCSERIPIERELLMNAARRVAVLTNEKSSSIKIALGKNKMKISVATPEVGEAHETIAVKYSGKEMEIAFNPEFLIDPLRQLTSDEVFLEVTDDLSPGVIKSDIPFLYVIMPMRVG